jgi:2-polyprenyl-6-methoxyphenol hydroxylase-like FAD-dependent oxidoreductase
MAGLFHAIILKHLGHKVHLLEKSPVSVLQSEAAGLNVGPQVQTLIDEYIKPTGPYTTTSAAVHAVNVKGEVINTIPSNPPLQLTTWSQLHSMLKSHVLSEGSDSSITYETDKVVHAVEYNGEKVVVTYLDTKTGKSSSLQADLVIAADGGHSKIRETVLPGPSPKYVGYVTWRGSVPASSISEASRSTMQNRVLMLRTEQGYIIS